MMENHPVQMAKPGRVNWGSLQVQITLGILIILAIIFFVFGKVAITEQRQKMMNQMEEYGSATTNFIAQISLVPLQKFSIYQLENYVHNLEQNKLVTYCDIFDDKDLLITQNVHGVERKPHGGVDKENLLVFSVPISENDVHYGRVEVGMDLEPVHVRINTISWHIVLAFCIGILLIGGVVSFFIHKKLVGPILKLSGITKTIAAGQFAVSSQAGRRDEIGELAGSINTMSRNLEDSYRSLERKVEERTVELKAAKDAAEGTNAHLEVVGAGLQALLDNSPVGILFIAEDYIIQRVNLEIFRITGYGASELSGHSISILFSDKESFRQSFELISQGLERDGVCQTTMRLQKKDGGCIICSVRGRLTVLDEGVGGVILSLEDVTARLQLEEELLKIKKLESVGVLAGGIAHDFNNILMAILGNLSLVEKIAGSDDRVAELLSQARNASLKAKELTVKLLTFAKGGESVNKTESLPDIVKESASFTLSGSNVKCRFDIEDDLWAVRMDREQINQVMQNLILNADQAISGGGRIDVTCRNRDVRAGDIAGLTQAKYVQLKIKDTGAGIAKENLPKVFDPYFSTREKDSYKGRGLGLSIVRSIIIKHNGGVFVRSSPGLGTEFTIYLPAVEKSAGGAEFEVDILPSGKGLVLVMDDDETVHTVVEEMLTYLGYKVLHCYNGEETLATYQEQQKTGLDVSLVIMDLTIPGAMGGVEAVRKLREIYPLAKVIVSSGYSGDPVVQDYQSSGFDNCISKPYQLLDLSRVIAETLKQKSDDNIEK